jgi:hypothetical protein
MKAIRVVAVHEHFGVDVGTGRQTAYADVPALSPLIEELLVRRSTLASRPPRVHAHPCTGVPLRSLAREPRCTFNHDCADCPPAINCE